MSQDYRDLIVWQRAIDMTVCIYQMTQLFPKTEIYGLTSQMRRASISIASNIAEGRGRLNPAEFRQFLGLAQGSAYELETQLLVSTRLGLIDEDRFATANAMANEISKMLTSFLQKLTIQQNRMKPANKKLGARG